MARPPMIVDEFLDLDPIAVAGVSNDPASPANHIARRLRETGHVVYGVNPKAGEADGEPIYRSFDEVPDVMRGVVAVIPPAAGLELVEKCAEHEVRAIWFHRSFGAGSCDTAACARARELGIQVLKGGCPMMYAGAVDPAHRCMRWILGWMGRLPGKG